MAEYANDRRLIADNALVMLEVSSHTHQMDAAEYASMRSAAVGGTLDAWWSGKSAEKAAWWSGLAAGDKLDLKAKIIAYNP